MSGSAEDGELTCETGESRAIIISRVDKGGIGVETIGAFTRLLSVCSLVYSSQSSTQLVSGKMPRPNFRSHSI